jgi:GT2 family glycosyltransferase
MNAPCRQPCIHVFLPVYDRRAVTQQFLECLRRQTYQRWHLLLIDDGSSDGTGAMARSMVPSLTLLRGDGSWWWAGSLHQGYLWARGAGLPEQDLVLMINDDTEIGPDFLANAVAAMRPGSLLLAQAYDSSGDFCEAGVFWDWKNLLCTGVKAHEEINCFSTRGLFMHVRDLLKIGGFHPRILPHYLSDYEFTIRAHRKGFALISSPDVSLRYFEALTGIRSTVGLSGWQTLKANLSIKSSSNPFHWTSFLILASPRRYLASNLARVWWGYFAPIHKVFLGPLRRWIWSGRAMLGRVKRRLKREWTGQKEDGVAGEPRGHDDR